MRRRRHKGQNPWQGTGLLSVASDAIIYLTESKYCIDQKEGRKMNIYEDKEEGVEGYCVMSNRGQAGKTPVWHLQAAA